MFRLDALGNNAYSAFQMSRNLKDVVNKILNSRSDVPGLKKDISISLKVGTPVLPMLVSHSRYVFCLTWLKIFGGGCNSYCK